MPYGTSGRLPAERASKLGHLEVLNSPLVNEIIQSFETINNTISDNIDVTSLNPEYSYVPIDDIISDVKPLNIIFGIDGSLQTIHGIEQSRKEMSFIKTAMLRLDQYALSKIDSRTPHPRRLKDILEKAAIYHATVIPLRNIRPQKLSLYDGVRQIINDSLHDDSLLEGEIYKTLKWLIFEEWDGIGKTVSERFDCPFCRKVAAFVKQGEDIGKCTSCSKEVMLSDFLGFHVEMNEEFAAGTVASSYMLIHETLLMLTAIKYFWEHKRKQLSDCLFVKDGGLYIRAHYSKLVAPIRRFLSFAKSQGHDIHIIGQEKTGNFVDYLDQFSKRMNDNTLFLPKDNIIKREILSRANHGGPYGRTSNYGAKLFIKLATHNLVLSVPTGRYTKDPEISDLIGIGRILATLPGILSFRFENGLLPIELSNGIASLSTYPSAKILRMFAEGE